MVNRKLNRSSIRTPRSDDWDYDPVFGLKFWRRIGPEGRMAACWEMTKLVWRLQGGVGELRLDKSVARVIWRERPARDRRPAR